MIYYLIFINLFCFIIYGLDKYLAIKKKNRISENNLLFFSLVGGSLGSIISMNLFHHKTKKKKFLINYFFFIVQIYLYVRWFI
ncbi:MAG: DUF1294 domain-containing protein [Bacilli bacterium]|nr:DUF1294 domain-containing protein [Bacilli bacterium]